MKCLDPTTSTTKFDYAPLNLREFNEPDELIHHYWNLARNEGDSGDMSQWLTEAFT